MRYWLILGYLLSVNIVLAAEKTDKKSTAKPAKVEHKSSWSDKVKNLVKKDEPAPAGTYRTRTNKDIWHGEDLSDLENNQEYLRGENALKSHDYQTAKTVFLQLTLQRPGSSSLWRRLGDGHYNLLELSSAIGAYERAVTLNPENYFALRGLAFAYLYHGHDLWNTADKNLAHDQYGRALKLLQQCLRIYPGDQEAMYGRCLAAEGASRRLYQNALALQKKGDKEAAAAAARNCVEIIDEGIESAKLRINKNQEEVGPRSIIGGLFQRRAILNHQFNQEEHALQNMENATRAYDSILKIDGENILAKKELERCQTLMKQWEEKAAAKEK